MSNSNSNKSKTLNSNKKMSLMMRNIDYNAYRGFKLSQETQENKKPNLKELVSTHFTNNGSMRFPFGLTEERFRWQTNKNIGEKKELTGKLVRRNSDGVSKKSDWKSLMDKTQDLDTSTNISKNRASSYKYRIEKNSTRTIVPSSDYTLESYHTRKNIRSNSTAIGGISDLLEKTPGTQEKYKKFSSKHLESHDIFNPLPAQDKMKLSIPVDLEKIKLQKNAGNYLRVKDKSIAEIPLKYICLLIYLVLLENIGIKV